MALEPADRFPDMTALAECAAGAARARRPGILPVVMDRGRRGADRSRRSRLGRHPAGAIAVAPAAAETIAVLPFSASGPGVEVLGEGMVDLLATNFDGVGGINRGPSRRGAPLAGCREGAPATGSAMRSSSDAISGRARS